MIRTVKVVSPINKGKLEGIHSFLVEYNECVNYFIARLWSKKEFNNKFLDTKYIESARLRFDLTSRLIQCAGKQASEIVKSQRKLSKRQQQMPRFKTLMANLDSRFWSVVEPKNTFEWLKLQSKFKFYIPFNKTKMWDKWTGKGFTQSKSLRLFIKKGKLIIEFFFEKEATELKTEGTVEGLDLGYVNLGYCSTGQVVGEHINEFIKTFKKREKHTHKQIEQRALQELKALDLSGVKTLVLEELKNVKSGNRGKFSREHNRRMSHWLYAKVTNWLKQRCEEFGIQIEFKSPYKTSQYCRICGKWDRRNRNGERFLCIHCGHEEHSDSNGAQNLKLLGLAGVYSLRLLKTDFQAHCL
jgi:IS605 OrfB family transposase